jgi:tRNA dimethylallyltransferase
VSAPRPVLVVAGPTAGGKSTLALAAAEEFGGTVVNADSMQVYRDLRILTARPTDAETARAPHRLFGVLDGDDSCSAGRWRAMAAVEIAEAHRGGRLPIMVGGTGLYLAALAGGLADIPKVPVDVVASVERRLKQAGAAALHAELAARDPAMAARLRPSDPQRLARALGVLEATGRSLADWQARPTPPLPALAFHRVLLMPPRAELYAACDARFTAMLAAGAIEEVRTLLARGLPSSRPVMKAIGVAELGAVLAGRMTLAAATAKAQQATRNYAKRQRTWFRHQMIADQTTETKLSESTVAGIFAKIRHFVLTHRN